MCKAYKILPGRYFTFLKNHENFKLKSVVGKQETEPSTVSVLLQLCCWHHRALVCTRSLVFCAHILHLEIGYTPSPHEDSARENQMWKLKNTVKTKFIPDYVTIIIGISFQYSTLQSMKLIMKGTCESKKAQVRECTSHSTRTYILNLGVEHCTRWQLKRLNHDLSNTLWIRIQCTSQVRIQIPEWLCVNGKNNYTNADLQA